MNYSTIPTVVGAAKLRNASLLGQKVDITRVAFGDGDGAEYEPTGQETTLKKQVYECPPNRIEEEAGAPTWIELEAVIPHNVGGWYLREVGCFDDEGDLIFIGNLPSSFKPSGEAGVIKDLVFEMVYDAVAANVVQIKIDPNVVIATRKYVDDQDKAHTDALDPHPQYATDEDLTSHINASNPHSQYALKSVVDKLATVQTQEVFAVGFVDNAAYQAFHPIPGATLTVAESGKYLLSAATRCWEKVVIGTFTFWSMSVFVNGISRPELRAFGCNILQTSSNKDTTANFTYPVDLNAGDVLQIHIFIYGDSGSLSFNYGDNENGGASMSLVKLGA